MVPPTATPPTSPQLAFSKMTRPPVPTSRQGHAVAFLEEPSVDLPAQSRVPTVAGTVIKLLSHAKWNKVCLSFPCGATTPGPWALLSHWQLVCPADARPGAGPFQFWLNCFGKTSFVGQTNRVSVGGRRSQSWKRFGGDLCGPTGAASQLH